MQGNTVTTGMSSNRLSAVLEEQIRHLCLNDFPCGHGSWRKTKDREGAETEDKDTLLDLLSCPHSPWKYDESWSPQVQALRQLAVLTPECLHSGFIYNYLTTLRIVDKGVSIIDDGLLNFSKLQELVLSANAISDIPAENLPSTLRILEIRANRLSALNRLISHPPPPYLHYLGLGSNSLGAHKDIPHLTGRHWPQLVCLDLSDCEFQDQQALLNALSTLPCLRTLLLEGNPFTLAPCYPGFTVDSLPRLSCLDSSWISPEERHCFKGLAKMSDLIVNWASVTVSVGRMRGIPDPMMSVEENTPDFPVVTYSYFVTYEFLNHGTPVDLKFDSGSKFDAAATAHLKQDNCNGGDLQSNKSHDKETPSRDTQDLAAYTGENCHDSAHVSRHSTSKLTWSDCIDFSDAQIYIISDLGALKRFLNRGLNLKIEEEKVLSWPEVTEDVTMNKPSQAGKEKKGRKGRESPIKSGSTKDKSKDKKKKSVPELVQGAPIRRVIGSVHVPLQSLVKRGQKVDVLCDLGDQHTESKMEPSQTLEKDLQKKTKEDKKKENKESKCKGANGKGKGKKKECETDVFTDNSVLVQQEPVTVEFTVELEKWRSTSEAHQLLLPKL